MPGLSSHSGSWVSGSVSSPVLHDAGVPVVTFGLCLPSAGVGWLCFNVFGLSLLPQVSFGSILTPVGVFLLTYGFGSFFQLLPGADVAAILLIYGFPITLLGFALSYAQLRPVPCKSTREALALRDSQSTDIQKQARTGF